MTTEQDEHLRGGGVALTVADVMVKPVIVVGPDRTARQAARTMSLHGIGCLVVVENDRVVGMVTERDLINRIIVEKRDPEETLVAEVMSRPPVVARPELPLEDAIGVMFMNKVKKLIVVEGEGERRRLAGLVTLSDIARVNRSLIERLKALFEDEGGSPPRRFEKTMGYYIV